MKNYTSTYRILAAALSLIVFISVGFPAGLHAMGMGEHCAESMEHPHKAAAGMDLELCEVNQQAQTSGHEHIAADQDMEDCELNFSCACTLANASLKAEAVPLSVKANVILPVSVLDFTTEFETAVAPRTDTTKSSAAPPPIFLVNSTFLN